jgi:UDP-N-acetylglucosamine transferase subunit ALG13
MSEEITNEAASRAIGRPVDLTKSAHYSPKLIEAIAEHFPVESIIALLQRITEAKVFTKDGRAMDDHRTQLAAAQLILNYVVGRPVERQEIVNVSLDADASAGLEARLKSSPAARAALRKALDSAEGAVDV